MILKLNKKITIVYHITIIMLVVIFFNISCVFDPPQKGIKIINNTDFAIYIAYSFNDSIKADLKLVPFETTYFNYAKHIISPDYRINAHMSNGIGIPGREELLSQSKDKKIRLFFITEQTMITYKWDEIVKNKLYKKVKIFSISDLKSTDWSVTYP